MLIHAWDDVALGNFIMQMSVSAPVPVTVAVAFQAAGTEHATTTTVIS